MIDLAADDLGGFVLFATDDYFAEKENLLRSDAPVFIEGKYTNKGKWMDGWESQRRKTPGHDHAVVRLGVAGRVKQLVIDTTHFKGNAPERVQVEVSADGAAYEVLLPETAVKPHFVNIFDVASDLRATHVLLRIYPDGGVARLRVLGDVVPDEKVFWQPAAIDLAAVENGGTVVEVSDKFFGPPSNLLLPGRGMNMGDGWETARRRTPGTDWAVLQLGRPGVIERIEIDTHFFKGNAPQAVTIEEPDGRVLLAKTPLEPHKRHVFIPDRRAVVSRLRVHIHPHGGVNRLRLYGYAIDSEAVTRKIALLDEPTLRSFNGSSKWVAQMKRPFTSARELFAHADAVWWSLDEASWLEAFGAHPRLGDKSRPNDEQAGVSADAELLRLNEEYARKHGFIFILCASGKKTEQVLEALRERIAHPREKELELAACEQAKIVRLRMERWLK